MPEKNYRVYFDDENSIFVYFDNNKGKVRRFVVKFLSIIDGREYEILRFDSAHKMFHIDILGPDGEKKQKIFLPHLTNDNAVEYAKKDIKQHYKLYRERFIQWKNKEQK